MRQGEINLIKRPGPEVDPHIARSLADCAISFVQNTEVVVGLELPNSPSIIAHGYAVTGTESEQTLSLKDEEVVDRLAEFYQRKYGSDINLFEKMYGANAGFHQDCHSMVRAILGIDYAVDGASGYPKDVAGYGAYITSLKPVTPYVGYIHGHDRGYYIAHSLLTTNDPRRVLNVLGMAGSMVVADVGVITDHYFGPEGLYKPLESSEVVYEVVLPTVST